MLRGLVLVADASIREAATPADLLSALGDTVWAVVAGRQAERSTDAAAGRGDPLAYTLTWFGWNDVSITLPTSTVLPRDVGELGPRIEDLTYFRVFGQGGELVWYRGASMPPVVRLCTEVSGAQWQRGDYKPPAGFQVLADDGGASSPPFEVVITRRILLGRRYRAEVGPQGAVRFEFREGRIPRSLHYRVGVEAGPYVERLSAIVYEYLDRRGRRVTTRYGTIEALA